MFVSPPPTYLIRQSSQKKYSKKRDNNNNNSNNQNLNSSSSSDILRQVDSNSLEQKQFHKPSIVRKDANFVSAPAEYADRARIEIRKRLSQSSQQQQQNHIIKDNHINNLDRVGTIESTDTNSIFSDNASSYQSSVFSHPSTIITQNTTNTGNSLLTHTKFITHLTLEDALPKTFYDTYSPELFTDPSKILYNGRPSFTKRELLDWDLNDIRSLLIIEQLRPEWGNRLPEIMTNESNLPKFRFILLPLCSSDDFIINTLVNSDLYIETNLDYEFKLTSAKYTVAAARKRHEQITGFNEPMMNLSKPEWRNIIENYLLNIAVEAQCRFDFKQQCSEFKKWKIQQTNLKKPDMPPPSVIPFSMRQDHGKLSNPLLKKALLKNMQMKIIQKQYSIDNTTVNNQNSNDTSLTSHGPKISLTKEEKSNIWSHCQSQVYQRLGLDWKPDGVR